MRMPTEVNVRSDGALQYFMMEWFVVIAIALAIALVAKLVSRARAAQTHARGPSCGNCGYLVHGLPSSQCPECGQQLTKVGVDSAATPRPQPPAAAVLCWSAMYVGPAVVAFWSILAIVPLETPVFSTIFLRYDGAAGYSETPWVRLEGFGTLSRPNFHTATILASTRKFGTEFCDVDVKSLQYSLRPNVQSNLPRSGKMDEHVMTMLLRQNGFRDDQGAAIEAKGDDLLLIIRQATTQTGPVVNLTTYRVIRTHMGQVRIYSRTTRIAVALVLVVIWFAGSAIIWFRYRRRLARWRGKLQPQEVEPRKGSLLSSTGN